MTLAILVLIVPAWTAALTTAASPPAVDRSTAPSTAKAFLGNPQARIGSVTQVDRYAMVAFGNGQIEGEIYSGQLLLQRFSFGWQVIDLSIHRFTTQDLVNHGITTSEARVLLHGFVAGSSKTGWGPLELGDYGPAADVDRIRMMVDWPSEAIGAVKIYSGYAMLLWFGRGGGEKVFAKRTGRWVQITSGGGCLDAAGLIHYGVSAAAAAHFAQWFPCAELKS